MNLNSIPTNPGPILQSFIIPVCRFNNKSRSIDFLYGTAFFTAVPGVFITAKHVCENVLQMSSSNEVQYGLCVKDPNNKNLFVPIEKNIDFAPNDLDIGIGRVNFDSKSSIKLVREPLKFMQNVEVYGYPEVASVIENQEACWIDMRGSKGYINREVDTKAKKLIQGEHEVELSFRIEAGMSGAPLFISDPRHGHVGGICVGTRTSEVYEYRINEQDKVQRHLEYGVACMTSSISLWKPSFLNDLEYKQLFI